MSVRKEPLETATLAVLQHHLLTEDHARLFVEELGREMARLTRGEDRRDEAARIRLGEVEAELGNLYRNLLAGLVGSAVRAMIEEREAEKVRLEATVRLQAKAVADILPHPALLDLFASKVAAFRATLDAASFRIEAAQVLSTLIESVTIHSGGENGPEVRWWLKSPIWWAGPRTTTPPLGAPRRVLWRWLRGQSFTAAERGFH